MTNSRPNRLQDPATDPRIDLLAGADTWHTPAAAGVPAIRMSDGPAGVRGTDWHGPASASFPCGTALAATFDPDLVREVGHALGREARSKNAQVLLAPTVNLHRTPIGGRNFECLSEDPVHTAAIAVAYIDGVQSERVACCVKHFVGNDTEFARHVVSSDIPERVLRELYLVPFEAAVGAGVRSIMTGYNRLNGIYCSEHPWLLQRVLREEWGFDGVVVSDWYGTHSTLEALLAGLDIEMPGPPNFRGERLRAALADPELDADRRATAEIRITDAAERIGALAEWTGAASAGSEERTAVDHETRAVSRRAAAAGMVLLRNVGSVLPLQHASRLALIGPYATTGRIQGGGSAKVRPDRPAAIIPALEDRGFSVRATPGCRIDRTLPILRGQFQVELGDDHGHRVISDRSKLELIRQHGDSDGLTGPIHVRFAGTFEVPESGCWRIGLRAVGAATVEIDGTEVVSLDGTESGGSFFGYGSDEVFGEIELDAGQEHHIEVISPSLETAEMRGVMVGGAPVEEHDLLAEAVALAAEAEVAVVVVGTNDEWETEGEDRADITLPGRQDELVSAVAAVNPNTVVVVNAGAPVAMPWLDEVPAVLQIWFPGGQLGAALADVLSGDVEPGGRLPVTFPRRLADTPAADHHPGDGQTAPYREGLRLGYRWYESEGIEPLFWFGSGLGYTTFEIGPTIVEGEPRSGIRVHTEVRNTGDRPGSEVVQVYTRYLGDHPEVEPLLRFIGSAKVTAVPDEAVAVSLDIGPRAFASWLEGRWQIPAGGHQVRIGRDAGSTVSVGVLDVLDVPD